MTFGIPDLAEIAEVDGVGPNLETPQHNDVQWWFDLYPAQPFGRPRGRERWRAPARGMAGTPRRWEDLSWLFLSWESYVISSP
jgi:hypothetical protein